MKEHPKKAQRCIICHRSGVDGISVGAELICQDCERHIVNSRSTDPGYDEILKGIRSLWKLYDAAGGEAESRDSEVAQS